MTVSISDFRKNLFKLVDRALEGDLIEIVHKGETIRLLTKPQVSKLDRLTPAQIFNPAISDEDHAQADREMLASMQTEWEKDWSGL
jgi:prevent-host-death family protein